MFQSAHTHTNNAARGDSLLPAGLLYPHSKGDCLGGGVGASQKNFFWGEIKLKKKEKKIWRPQKIGATPPQKLETPPEKLETPPKIGDPPKNWRPPQKIGGPPEKLETPPRVDRHTLVKILPWPNFVAAGNCTFLKDYRVHRCEFQVI